MPLSTAAKAALCICPPALMAGTVATVPAVKRAVHHVTAPRHAPRPIRQAAASPPVAPAAVRQQVDCNPGFGGSLPAVPLVTYAEPLPDEPGGFVGPGGAGPFPAAVGIGGGGGGGVTPVVPQPPETPGTGPVPEPSVWLMMITGIGTLGATLRRRRRGTSRDRSAGRSFGSGRKVTAGGLLWSGSAAVEAGDMAATVAVKSAVASAAGKAMLCVCPAVVVAGSVMTVPPLRQAVHAATTMPRTVPSLAAFAAPVTLPCLEPTVPVAASSVDGFPATVATTPATVAAAAPETVAASSSPTATAG